MMASREFARVIPLESIWPVGFAFQALWSPLIVRQTYVDHGSVDIHLVFYASFGVLSLMVALVFLARFLRSFEVPYRGLAVFSMVCKLYASIALTLDLFAGSEIAAFSGSVLGAAGAVASMLAWGSFLKRLPIRQAVAYILISYMAVFFLQPLCYMLFPMGASILLSLLAICGPLSLVLSHYSLPEPAASAPSLLQDEAVPSEDKPESTETLRNRAPFLGLLGAFAAYSFVLTLRSTPNFLSGNLALIALYSVALIITLVIYWRMIIVQEPSTFERMVQLLLAVFAIGFFMQPFAPGIFSEVVPALFMVATALMYMLAWLVVVDIIHIAKIHPFAVVGIWGACYGCPRLLYYVLESAIPIQDGSFEATMTISFVALFGLFVAFFLFTRHSSESRSLFKALAQPSSSKDDSALPVSEWCDLAREHGLTDRESEVFYLVCEGHPRRIIAEQLFVSENTVKAHLKRIYSKMGVHSKHELRQIINPKEVK